MDKGGGLKNVAIGSVSCINSLSPANNLESAVSDAPVTSNPFANISFTTENKDPTALASSKFDSVSKSSTQEPIPSANTLPPRQATGSGTSSLSLSIQIPSSADSTMPLKTGLSATSTQPIKSLSHPSPSKSPKLNPFSSASPKTNPFVSMGAPKDHFWGDEVSSQDKADADPELQPEKSAPIPAPALVPKVGISSVFGASTMTNPFASYSTGISNAFGAFGANKFQIGGSAGMPFGGGGGLLNSLNKAPVAMFGNTVSDTSGMTVGNIASSTTASLRESAVSSAGADDADGADEGEDNPEEDRSTAVFGKTYAMAGGPVLTGEEDEECLFQVRAKLYRLVTSTTKAATDTPDDDEHQREPSKSTAKAEDHDDDAPGNEGPNKSQVAMEANAAGSRGKKTAEWVEVGIGPVRVLRALSQNGAPSDTSDNLETRIVMRREEKKGGTGTKVLLNLRITSMCTVHLSGDKAFSLSTIAPKSVIPVITEHAASGTDTAVANTSVNGISSTSPCMEPVSYMLKCKTSVETDKLVTLVTRAADAKKLKH
jgi:hypothetical protein